jgi:2'-5' RNA ligase
MQRVYGLIFGLIMSPIFAQTTPQDFSVWLIPQTQDYTYLQGKINELAQKHDAPLFRPHVTIYYGKTDSMDKMKSLIKKIAKNTKPVTLTINGIDVTPARFKTLFVTFSPDTTLTARSQEIAATAVQDQYHLALHLSLLYKDMSLEEKRKILGQTSIARSTIKFDRIELIREDDPDDVNKWIPVLSERLNSGKFKKAIDNPKKSS